MTGGKGGAFPDHRNAQAYKAYLVTLTLLKSSRPNGLT